MKPNPALLDREQFSVKEYVFSSIEEFIGKVPQLRCIHSYIWIHLRAVGAIPRKPLNAISPGYGQNGDMIPYVLTVAGHGLANFARKIQRSIGQKMLKSVRLQPTKHTTRPTIKRMLRNCVRQGEIDIMRIPSHPNSVVKFSANDWAKHIRTISRSISARIGLHSIRNKPSATETLIVESRCLYAEPLTSTCEETSKNRELLSILDAISPFSRPTLLLDSETECRGIITARYGT